jgi:hypothetical protein
MTEDDGHLGGTVEVILSVPADMRYQLVYRQERSRPFDEKSIAGHEFHFIGFSTGLLKVFRAATGAMGMAEAVKAALKLLTRKRYLYLFTTEGRVSHYGWVNLGFCNHYEVAARDVVLGPIWTGVSDRGLGLATEALKRAMNAMIEKGCTVFFIDTGDENLPCQRAIAKASFPPAAGAYLRGKRRTGTDARE